MKKILLAILGTLVFACIGLFVLGLVFSESEETIAEETEAKVVLVEPTEAIVTEPPPTEIAITPEPTATLLPVATPTPSMSLGEEEYADWVADVGTLLSQAMLDFGALNEEAGENPYLMFNDDWIMEVALTLIQINWVSEDIIDRGQVPSRFDNVHQNLVLAAEELLRFTDKYARGLDALDIALLEESLAHLSNSSDYIVIATDLIE